MNVPGPLHGIRILDLSWLLPGPFCTSVLADLGADVVKVESPGAGDYMRELVPDAFLAVNRNKRSICLNLKDPDGKALLLDLAKNADVLIEGFRPGVVDRLGIGYEDLKAQNPAIVYVSLSGYGATGPYSRRPGHDLNYLAVSGALSIPGRWGEQATRPGLPIGDLFSGFYAAVSILAALRRRDEAGEGSLLDVSITDSLLALAQVRLSGRVNGTEAGWRHLSPANDIFRTADGEMMTLCLVEEHFWTAFCRIAGRADLPADETMRRARTPQATPAEGRALQETLQAIVGSRTLAQWLDLLDGSDVPYARVNQAADLRADPQIVHRGGLRPMSEDDPTLIFDYPVPQLRRDRHSAAPVHGEHTDTVLIEAGLSKRECERLRDRGAIK